MRSRNIKPGFFINEKLVALPFSTRLLFIGLWCMADCRGVLEDRPVKIKIAIFPCDDVDVVGALDDLQGAGLLTRYVDHQGNPFLHISNFLRHQNPHHREKPSDFPLPTDTGCSQGKALGCGNQGSGIRNQESGIRNQESGIRRAGTRPAPGQPQASPGLADLEAQVDGVIEYFKRITGKTKVSEKAEGNRKHIRARLRDDHIPLTDLLAVIDLKAHQVKQGAFPSRYLRIETLFNATKCQSYLSELDGLQGEGNAKVSGNLAVLQQVLEGDL